MISQRGFSIVELMIGLAIGLLMLTVLSGLLVNNSQARVELDRTMQQVENGRYAMQLLSGELRLAGYYGAGAAVDTPLALAPNPCATDAASLKAALAVAVQGYSQVAVSPLACLASANIQPGSDILVIRRALTEPVALAALVATTPYIQATGDAMVFDLGSNPGSFGLTNLSGGLASIYPYSVQIYFVSPCSNSGAGACTAGSDNGKPIPTLKRLELAAGGWSAPVSLVEGIEKLRVEYGVDNDGDGAPDNYVLTPVTGTDWNNVVSVNVGLLARNTQATRGHKDKKTYQLGTLNVAATEDEFKRHAYNGVMRLTNVSSRRVKGSTL